MAGSCKSCFSSHREVIDERLKKGESIEKLSEWLKGQGEMISPPSLLRHRKNHIPSMALENNTTGSFIGDSKTPPKNAGDDDSNEPFIDTSAVLARIASETADTNIFTSVLEARKFTQILMERIVQNQLVIVHELQQQYSAGKAGYPDSQIRGLKTILDITNALPTYTDKNLYRKLSDTNEEMYVDKIRSNAIAQAKIDNKKYNTWDCLRGIYRHETSFDYIDTLAAQFYPVHAKGRNTWIEKMRGYWEECFLGDMPSEYTEERIIQDYTDEGIQQIEFDYESDEYEANYERAEKILCEKVIARFVEPWTAKRDLDVLAEFIENEIQIIKTEFETSSEEEPV